MTGHYRLSVFLLLVVFVAIPAAVAVHPQTQAEADAPPGVGPAGAEWPRVGGDLGGMRYSKLTQITMENVKNLSGRLGHQVRPRLELAGDSCCAGRPDVSDSRDQCLRTQRQDRRGPSGSA